LTPNPSPHATPLNIHKLTQAKMVERQLKGLFYNCDDKYFPRHKCKEQNISMAIFDGFFDKDVDVSHVEEIPQAYYHTLPSNPLNVEPLISLNTLTGFSTPQTLKLIGYIKHRKFIILVDIINTHNFSHRYISKESQQAPLRSSVPT
jgi:hypothetical protein